MVFCSTTNFENPVKIYFMIITKYINLTMLLIKTKSNMNILKQKKEEEKLKEVFLIAAS